MKAPELVQKTGEHLVLTGASAGVAVLIGVPLGIYITRRAVVRGPVLGLTNVIMTIPSLAMLAFLLPFLGIGLKPAVVALTLYALLPIVRNTYTGLSGVSDDVIEAAEGMGFTRSQRLFMVELPLALPVLVAGVRMAAVICVGIATLSSFIGAGGLGDFINRGLALNNNRLILLGAIPAAILALIIDAFVGSLETLLSRGLKPPREKTRAKVVLGFVSVLIIAAMVMAWRVQAQHSKTLGSGATIQIGTKEFSESYILGHMMGLLIEDKTELNVNQLALGGTMICHQALINGEIDIYPEYTGTALMAILEHDVITDPPEVYKLVSRIYPERFGATWLAPFGVNNAYTITVRREDAEKYGWKKVSDLAPMADQLTAGFEPEFNERPDGYPGLRKLYGFAFGTMNEMDPGLMYSAIAEGKVDVICAFATDGRIPAYDLQVLEDDRQFFPPYFAAPLVRTEILERYPEVRRALAPLGNLIDNRTMQKLNYEVDEKKRPPVDVAREFLLEKKLISE